MNWKYDNYINSANIDHESHNNEILFDGKISMIMNQMINSNEMVQNTNINLQSKQFLILPIWLFVINYPMKWRKINIYPGSSLGYC